MLVPQSGTISSATAPTRLGQRKECASIPAPSERNSGAFRYEHADVRNPGYSPRDESLRCAMANRDGNPDHLPVDFHLI
jgi:hypothetical protein